MWVLEPVAAQPGAAATASQPAAAATRAQLQQTTFLSSAGSISLGRPLKKGSSVGKADILVFNEQSVSAIHATLTVGAGQNRSGSDDAAAQAFAHGALSITDGSKFGTHLTRAGSQQEARLPKDEATPLSEGDVLRFGSNARFAVQRLRLLLCASDACRAQHPELQVQADAVNGELVGSCSSAAAGPAAAAQLEACYALVLERGQHLCPALLRALLQPEQCRLVTPAWLAAVATHKACAASLPPAAEFAPQQLLLPPLPGQEQGRVLEVAAWQRPAGTLLARYHLVFQAGSETDLVAAATSCGAQCVQLQGRAQPARLQEQQPAAAAAHRTAVFVSAHKFGEGSGEQPAAPAALPAVTGLQMLHALATGSASAIAAAVAQHSGTGQPHRHAKAAAEPGADEEADVTEEEEDHMEAEAGGSDASAPAEAAAEAAAAAAGPAAREQRQQQQQESSVLASPSSLADGGWHQHSRGRGTPSQPASEPPAAAAAPASGRRAGHKRGAAAAGGSDEAAAAAGGGAATPASKRRKTAAAAAGNSPGKAPQQLQQLPPGQPQGSEAPSQAPGGAGVATDGGTVQPQYVSMQLCLSANEQRLQQQQLARAHATTAAALGQEAPSAASNSKTFRPKQLLWELGLLQQGSNRQHRHRQQSCMEPEIRLVAVDLNLQQPDDEARLRELRQVEERARVANALFLADVKATSAPAAPRGGAGGRAKKK